jgi:tetratricopeptide (TPR) repeat protein
MHPKTAYARAREAAQKALELEDGSGAAHAAMATVLFFHDWDFDGAYRHFQKALSLTPGAAPLRRLYAMYLKAMGDGEGAEEELQLALQLDPLSSAIRTALGETLLHLDRAGEAEAQFRQVLELDPEFRSAREMLGWAYVAQGRITEAMQEYEEIIRRTGDPFKVIPHRIFALTAMGREEEARQLLGLLEERRLREPEVSLEVDFCFAHMGLGDVEKALDYMEEAVDLRLGFALFLGGHRLFDGVRSHPRFVRLRERIGLPALAESN